MSLQLHIYRERAGLLEEDKKTLAQKIKDFIEYLKNHDEDEDVKKLHDENEEDFNPDEDEEEKKLREEFLQSLTEEEKQAKLGSNAKGVLHELLVGKHLNGGKHMEKHPDKEGLSPKEAHDKIKKVLHPHEYKRLETKAKSAAENIKKHIEKSGHKISHVHWTSQPGDTKRSTGIEASQKEDASDIVVHSHKAGKKKFHGVSLKVTDGKNKHITASNPGMEATHGGHHIIDKHREELLKAHPKLVGVKSPEKRKEMMRNDPKMKQDIVSRNHKAVVDLAAHVHKQLKSKSKEDLVHHIRTHVLQSNKTPMQHHGHEHIRHTTYVSGKKEGSVDLHHAINPSEHWNHILHDHKNITTQHAGGNVHFLHKGKKFATHRMRVSSSSDPLTSFKGDGKAHSD